jgi:hypothetical protein
MAGAGEPCESLLPKRAPSSTASPLPMYKYPHSSFLLLKNFFLFHLPISFILPSLSSSHLFHPPIYFIPYFINHPSSIKSSIISLGLITSSIIYTSMTDHNTDVSQGFHL